MKKLVLILSALLFLIGTTDVQAQWGKKLLKKAGESAKRATERNVEKKIDKAVDKTFDSAEDAVTGKGNDDKGEKKANTNSQGEVEAMDDGGVVAEEQQTKKQVEMSWNKFDFVAGDEVIFEDQLVGEKMGEFPSQWDLMAGNIEVVQLDDENAVLLYKDCRLCPLMKEPKNYLPEIFTIELDVFLYDKAEKKSNGYYHFRINDGKNDVIYFGFYGHPNDGQIRTSCDVITSSGEKTRINGTAPFTQSGWQRVSISFNKRALKIYVNQTRVVNAPNVAQGNWFNLAGSYTGVSDETYFYFRNVRIAKGAVPLYDRMMSDGKFITYGITFDVGKSTIKPESMGEINRIVTLMKENPDLKFSVEGHTDSTGNEASNQTLSEAHSKAIVDKLIELGIATDRLTASGKGQSSPIADNGTDEGRAKNRRVEFVKL